MPSESELRRHRCCFTGHRPEKLTRSKAEIRLDLAHEILQAIDEGYTVFISGMARGVDQWAAEIVLQLRKKNKAIKLICAIPYKGVESRWSFKDQRAYRNILSKADYIQTIDSEYSPDIFQIRNEWMVNRSSKLIAVYNGYPSGTRNTINYAMRQGIVISRIQG